MRKNITLFVVIFLLMSMVCAEGKIGLELQKKMNGVRSEKIRITVFFEKAPSYSTIASEYRFLGERNVIKDQVIRELKTRAENAHHWLKQMCTTRSMAGKVESFRSLWIANCVCLKATPEAIKEIARQPGVKEIVLDDPVPMLVETREMTWGVAKIGAEEIWQYHNGEGVTVAVVDTGVNEHNDLKGRVIDGKNYIEVGKPPRDDHSHGTHCAGSVAGDGASGSHTGVAPKAKIFAVRVLGGNGSGAWSNLYEGIEDLVDDEKAKAAGVKVVSMSLGGNAQGTTRDRLRESCKTAINGGLILVIAAGNSGPSSNTVGSPGDVPEVITIGATDKSDNIAYFSSRGPDSWTDTGEIIKPDVSGPGVSVKSCKNDDLSGYSTKSGTSMATPHVAGLVALMVDAYPRLSNEKAKAILERTALDLGVAGKDNIYGAGRVQAKLAVNAAKNLRSTERGRWETVVKKLSFKVKIKDKKFFMSETIDNELMPATVSIWVKVREQEGQTGQYSVKFKLKGPDGKVKEGKVDIDFANLPTNKDDYDPQYGFRCGNFELVKGSYTGSVEGKYSGKDIEIHFDGVATWPAR